MPQQTRVHAGVPAGGQFATTTHGEPEVSLTPTPQLAPPLELSHQEAFKLTLEDDDSESEDWTNYSRSSTYKPLPASAPALRKLLGLPEGSRAPITIWRYESGSGDGWALDEAHDTVEVTSGKLKFELEGNEPMERLLTRVNYAHRNPAVEVERLLAIEDWRRAIAITFDDGSVEEGTADHVDKTPAWQRSKLRLKGSGIVIVDVVQQEWCKE
jgi:hypothetical protein